MKKVVFIDWNKTLSHDLFWGQLKNPSHIHHTYHASIDRWLFKENSVLIEPWMLGKLSYQEVAYKMSQSTNISIDIITKELRFSCEKMRFCINGIENIIRDIQKKGVKVVIATDNMDTFTKFTVPALRLDALFDNILNSYEIRRLKDDVDPISGILFFDTFLKEHNLQYSDAVLLDDMPDNSGKYKRLGFDRVLIDTSHTLKSTLKRYAYEN